jgi:hypothetical protein
MSALPNPDEMPPEARAWLERVQQFRRANPDALRSPDIHPTRRRTDPAPDPRADHEQPDLLGEGPTPKPWPQTLAASDEQGVLSIETTNQRKYDAGRRPPKASGSLAKCCDGPGPRGTRGSGASASKRSRTTYAGSARRK